MSCLFCRIINREIPATIVYEDEHALAFLDISEVTEGHTLVIPKQHFDDVLACDSKLVEHLNGVAQTIGHAQLRGLHANGLNIITNARASAGQSVFHYHIHVIPRYDGDDFQPHFPNHMGKHTPVQMGEIALKIKENIK